MAQASPIETKKLPMLAESNKTVACPSKSLPHHLGVKDVLLRLLQEAGKSVLVDKGPKWSK